MAIRNSAKYLAAALLAVACTVQESIDTQAPGNSEPVASNTLYIQFTDEMLSLVEEDLNAGIPTKSAGLNTALEELGIARLERVFPDAGEFEERSRKMGMHRFYKAVLSDNTPATKASLSLSEVPGVASAHPARRYRLRGYTSPNDPRFSNQWHYYNKKYTGADINVRGVWDKYTTGSNKVTVCVIDECVDPTHDDLKANLWKDENGHTGYNFAHNNWDLSIGRNYSGHGTHVAGTIGAVSNNGKGVAGIAGGDYAAGIPGVKIMSCAVFAGDDIADDAGFANAFKFGADHGGVIAQNSWGVYADGILDAADEDGVVSAEEMAYLKSLTIDDDPELKAAIDYFIQYAGCDAQGNQLPDSPMKGGLVFFASGNEGDQGVDYDPYGVYEPVIAVGATRETGASAYYSNFGTWIDVAAPGGYGSSSSNSIWSTVPTKLEQSGYGGEGWAGTSMACPHAAGVAALIVSYFGGPGFTADAAKEILFAGLGDVIGGSKPVGRKLNALASFEYGVQHYPAGGGSSEDPAAPILNLAQNQVTVKAHEEVTVSFTAIDPNGDAVTLSLQPGSRAISLDQTRNLLVIDGWKDTPGTYTAVLTASDGVLFSQKSLEYTLLPNHAPVVTDIPQDMYLEGLQKAGTYHLNGLFRDEDGEELVIHAQSSDENCARVGVEKVEDSVRLLVTPVGYGNAVITITASDFIGEEVSVSFRVAVVNPEQPVHVTSEVSSTDTYVCIETQDPVPVYVKVYSSTGTLVLETQAQASAFDPVHLDVSVLAPGRYTAVLEYSGIIRKVRFVKY